MITEERINFFKNIPPYRFLSEPSLMKIVGNLSMEFFPRGTYIMKHDGPPNEAVRVIRQGGVKAFLPDDEDVVIDYKSEGDSFGYVSLVNNGRSRTNLFTVEDTICYLIPKEIVMEVAAGEPLFGEYFMKSFLNNYLDKTYMEMKEKNLMLKEGEKLLYRSSVKHLTGKEAVCALPDTSIRDAAETMSQKKISSLVIIDERGDLSGIITDRDLRDKVIAKGMDTSAPVRNIMSTGLVSVDSDESCFDALALMIQKNVHHLLVTDKGRLKGVVTNHDFMLLQGTSPLSLLKSIERQKSIKGLSDVYSRITLTLSVLFEGGIRADNILRIITELHDRFLRKIVELALEEIDAPSSQFTFFVYGAEGRKEETFKTVFRCAVVYDDSKDLIEKREMNEFCQNLFSLIYDALKKCGLPLFELSPLGTGSAVYGDISDWEEAVLFSLKENGIQAYPRKMLDMRAIFGREERVEELRSRLYKKITDRNLLGTIMPVPSAGERSPVGFYKKFVVDEAGRQMDELDIKEKGILLIVDTIRAAAVSMGMRETSTTGRLSSLSSKGFLREIEKEINSAFEFLLHLLLQTQLLKRERGLEIDNLIDPGRLSVLEKKTLKEVFEVIQRLHEAVIDIFNDKEALVR